MNQAPPVSFGDGRPPSRKHRGTGRSVLIVDRLAGAGITGGGIAVILAVIGIFAFVVFEVFPLFQKAKAWEISRSAADARGLLLVGVNEYRERAYSVGRDPEIRIWNPTTGELVERVTVDSIADGEISCAARTVTNDRIALGTDDGRVQLARVVFGAEYPDERARISTAAVELDEMLDLGGGTDPILDLALAAGEDRSVLLAKVGRNRLVCRLTTIETTLLGDESREMSLFDLSSEIPSEVTALACTDEGDRLFVGLADGGVQVWEVESNVVREIETFQAIDDPSRAVTALAVAVAGNTVIVGGEDGSVVGWFRVADPSAGPGEKRFAPIHRFRPHSEPVTALAPSRRDRGFLSADSGGAIRLHYLTSERTLLDLEEPVSAGVLAFAPKADGFLAGLADGSIAHFGLENPHPEISGKVLFGKVWYEGYDRPEYVWQSSGATDEFEGKFSMIPLIFGTIKGTLYALLFAVPIALLAAVYASQFLHYRIRNVLKPTIEIMAALPSVVLGLVAGLFLAPHLETLVPGTALMFLIGPALILGLSIAWRFTPRAITGRVPTGTEILLLVPVAVLGVWLSLELGPVVEKLLFHGDFRAWLYNTQDVRYDQRNCIIVGFAMGFAVIPIIFTICEDSLSAVPQHLVSGSIACGASRWQTALRIVLPAAGSGIFSAIMIGFGRAVGETMIVLMATGNTPVIDWSIFNGMRTLSANIAVEIPEAPYRGTLYRMLFLSGLLLFTSTFLINGLAEFVRIRLRRKYANY